MRFAPAGIIFSPVKISCSATDAQPGSRCSFFIGVHFYLWCSFLLWHQLKRRRIEPTSSALIQPFGGYMRRLLAILLLLPVLAMAQTAAPKKAATKAKPAGPAPVVVT